MTDPTKAICAKLRDKHAIAEKGVFYLAPVAEEAAKHIESLAELLQQCAREQAALSDMCAEAMGRVGELEKRLAEREKGDA